MATWLNYHHLYYLRTVVRAGGVSEASEQLRLTQPTVSAQLRQLEASLDARLFERDGRRLKLTAEGQVAFRYAEEIFSLGEEMLAVLAGSADSRQPVLRVGVVDVFPKMVAVRLCEPILSGDRPPRLTVEEARLEDLLARLATHDLDLVIADRPVPPGSRVRAYSHYLGESEVSFLATKRLAARFRRGFPESLNGAPLLLPSANAELRRALDRWFHELSLTPNIVGEFEDSAMMKMFAESGSGIVPIPTIVEPRVRRDFHLTAVGRTDAVSERFYLLSAERKVTHPSVLAISQAASERLFGSKRRRGET